MNIIVPVKQVPDPTAIRFDSSGHFSDNTPKVVNEYDQYALEAAVQLEEADSAVDITVVSIGSGSAKDAISRGLAMGADRGLLIESGNQTISSLATAKVLSIIIESGEFDLVIMGQETSDSGTGNVGPQLAAITGRPFVSNVVDLVRDGSTMTVQREVEDGRHVVELSMPAIVCALTGLNEPRYPSLKGIMAARRKPVDVQNLSEFEEITNTVSWSNLHEEENVVEGVMIEADTETAVQQIVQLLQEKELL